MGDGAWRPGITPPPHDSLVSLEVSVWNCHWKSCRLSHTSGTPPTPAILTPGVPFLTTLLDQASAEQFAVPPQGVLAGGWMSARQH